MVKIFAYANFVAIRPPLQTIKIMTIPLSVRGSVIKLDARAEQNIILYATPKRKKIENVLESFESIKSARRTPSQGRTLFENPLELKKKRRGLTFFLVILIN